MIKVRSRIYLYKHKGRRTPFNNGYRPGFSFTVDNTTVFTGHIELINQNVFERGTLGEVFITFTSGSLVKDFIKVGQTFSFNEPPNEIGEGEILEVIES